MPVIRVDQVSSETNQIFAYECKFGYLEQVEVFLEEELVIISCENEDDEDYVVQYSDIPNLIKALQAAQKYIEENT